DQVATRQAIPSQENDPNLTYARSVSYAFTWNILSTSDVPVSSLAVSKRRISHWLVDTIRTAYQARGHPARW
ncbi:hypothetical protein M9458_041681, partial [Cirrhinus mrigala]